MATDSGARPVAGGGRVKVLEGLRTQILKLADPANAPIVSQLAKQSVIRADGELVRIFVDCELQDKGEDGLRPVLISTDGIDRMGDIVVPDGVDLRNYRKNPVILFAHDYSIPPIGSAMWVKKVDNGLLAKPRFASTQLAQDIKTLYDEGHMRAWSIGFMVREWEPIDKVNDPQGWKGRRFTKTELLEFSAVPVPANPEALSLALAKGLAVSRTIVSLMLPEEPETATETETASFTKGDLEAGEMRSQEQQIAELSAAVRMLTDRAEASDARVGELQNTLELTQIKNTELRAQLQELQRATTSTTVLTLKSAPADGASRIAIRVDGKDLTAEGLALIVQETVDGLVAKRAGVVSQGPRKT